MAYWPWMLRDIGRLRRITSILARHGFSDVAARLRFGAWLKNLFNKIFRRPLSSPIQLKRKDGSGRAWATFDWKCLPQGRNWCQCTSFRSCVFGIRFQAFL